MERINKVALISKAAWLAAGEFQRFRAHNWLYSLINKAA